jgi:quercetin dioxygenase-like cupin family protein
MSAVLRSVVLLLLAGCAGGASSGIAGALRITLPQDVKWEPAPGLGGGPESHLQYGDPASGPYQVLIKVPTGTVVKPHYHKADEVAAFISGLTLHGGGDEIDEKHAVEVGGGGYLHVPPGSSHWSRCKEEVRVVRFCPGPRDVVPPPGPVRPSAAKTVPAKDVPWAAVADIPGATRAELYGDPAKGPSVFLIRFPSGTIRPPHRHGADECVSVLSGTLQLGNGEQLDESRSTWIPPGGYAVIPAGVPHWIQTRGDTVLMVSVYGPRDVVYVDPKRK